MKWLGKLVEKMIIFQLLARKKEPTRQEMIDFIKQERIIRPATVEEAQQFIRKKYGDRKWVDDLFSHVKFVYEKLSYGTNAEYDREKNEIHLPEYFLGWRETYPKEWMKEKPKLVEEYLKVSRTTKIDDASNELIKELYAQIKGWKPQLESAKRKKTILEAMDHEIGHIVLEKIKNNDPRFGVSYADVKDYLVQRMKKNKQLVVKIAGNYLPFMYFGELPYKKQLEEIEKIVFAPFPDPKTIHPKGDRIIEDMLNEDHEPAIIVTMFDIKRETPSLHEVLDSLKGQLTENEITHLKEEAKNIEDLNNRFGLKVEFSDYFCTISYGETRKTITERYGLTLEQYEKFVDLQSRILQFDIIMGELLSRLLDAFTDGVTREDLIKIRPGITPADLNFFSRFTFDGEPMYGPEIEAMRKKLNVPVRTR